MSRPVFPRFLSLWAINGPLDADRLCAQLDALKASGLEGVVFHPRFYPNEPAYLGNEYLRIVSDAILHAKSIGMAFWLYDEDGWPSGTVSGQLLKKHPGDAQRWAGLVRERPADSARLLAEFEHGGVRWFLVENIGPGVDYLNPGLGRHFIEMTHERYRAGLAPEAFDYVEAIFSDEPEFGLGHAFDCLPPDGALPWTPGLPEAFRVRCGEELEPLLPLLFFPGERAGEVRIKFWELVTDLFNEAFVAPTDAWCRRYGKRFTAHVKGEEHPLFQIPTSGSCHQFFRNLGLPGIDALERYPANNFYPRQVSSAARQFGDGRCMVEAFGGSGWGSAPEDLERYLLWLGRNGLTDFVMHLSQYRLDSAAMHDWPLSEPLHLTWSHVYADILKRVRAELSATPRPPADTLLIAPYRGIMAEYSPAELLRTNVHNAATYPDTVAGGMNRRFMAEVEGLHAAGVAYDVADERSVEEAGRVDGGGLRLGNCVYRRVIIDPAARLSAASRALVRPFTLDGPVLKSCPDADSTNPEPWISLKVSWGLVTHPVNSWLLECRATGPGEFTSCFSSGPLSSRLKSLGDDPTLLREALHWGCDDLEFLLRFADEVLEASVNGETLALRATNEGSVALVDSQLLGSENELKFRLSGKVTRPFVWLEGRFRVASRSGFAAGPAGVESTLKTQGPFRLEAARKAIGLNLVADGFPFLRAPLWVEAKVVIPRDTTHLRLDDVVADAARLTVDGRDAGWSWPRAGELSFETVLAAGEHLLRLELVPNGFNSYGPHHYYAGDWHVVSPDQIKGVRNFADAPGAPAHTHVPAWHFRPFALPRALSIR